MFKLSTILIAITILAACKDNNLPPKDAQEAQTDSEQEAEVPENEDEDNSEVLLDSIWLNMDISRIDALVYSPHAAGPSMSAYIVNWESKNLHPSVAHSYTKTLNKDQMEIIINHLVHGKDMNGVDEVAKSGCFHPHHGFIYYNSNNEMVGQSSICFECESIRSNPKNTVYIDYEVFKRVFEELEIPILDNDDQYDSLKVIEIGIYNESESDTLIRGEENKIFTAYDPEFTDITLTCEGCLGLERVKSCYLAIPGDKDAIVFRLNGKKNNRNQEICSKTFVVRD